MRKYVVQRNLQYGNDLDIEKLFGFKITEI